MPTPLERYWTAWNEPDLSLVAHHLVGAVADHVEWNDPRDSFVGALELERAICRLRTTRPEYRFLIVSEIDHHHDRLRYRWDMVRGRRVLMEGTDIVTLDPASGLIARVDGFFGHPTPIDTAKTTIPSELRPES